MLPRIMYVERKMDGMNGIARIGRVKFSKSGKSLYYAGRTLQTLSAAVLRPTTLTSKRARSTGFQVARNAAATRSTVEWSQSTKMCGKSIGRRFAGCPSTRTAEPSRAPASSQSSMRYVDFKNAIHRALRRNAAGLTWAQLQQKLNLPYNRPCPAWTKQLEQEIGLSRVAGAGRALVWKIGRDL
jgi:hypothetical protein